MKKIVLIIGTRPEAIKLAPVARELAQRGGCRVIILISAQHRAMLDQTLRVLKIQPDIDLNLMRQGQTPNEVLSRVVGKTAIFLRRARPDWVIVQGDTTTAAGAALAAFNEKIPVAHVEAGLRTRDFENPFPEEGNRVVIDHLSTLCFAPTQHARNNLLREGIARPRVFVTGNTIADAVRWALPQARPGRSPLWREIASFKDKRIVLVTLHRRESFGSPLETIALGLRLALNANPDVLAIYPVHPNPGVRQAARRFFRHERVIQCEPLGYFEFLSLMKASYAILTDSGGIQEEAAILRKPVLIAREKTERPEVVSAGAGIVAGRSEAGIAKSLGRILSDAAFYRKMSSRASPFGDGHASRRIVDAIARFLS